MTNYTILEAGEGKHVKAWMNGVDFGANTIQQLLKAARLSCVPSYVAAMPDAHDKLLWSKAKEFFRGYFGADTYVQEREAAAVLAELQRLYKIAYSLGDPYKLFGILKDAVDQAKPESKTSPDGTGYSL